MDIPTDFRVHPGLVISGGMMLFRCVGVEVLN